MRQPCTSRDRGADPTRSELQPVRGGHARSSRLDLRKVKAELRLEDRFEIRRLANLVWTINEIRMAYMAMASIMASRYWRPHKGCT